MKVVSIIVAAALAVSAVSAKKEKTKGRFVGTKNLKTKEGNRLGNDRKLMGKGGSKEEPYKISCSGLCPYNTYYIYESAESSTNLEKAFDGPDNCVLAAISDERSRRGAQYAIPDGKVAITSGYFPLEKYFTCHFSNAKSDEGEVIGCGEYDYTSYFVNFDGSSVVSDDSCWDTKSEMPDGAIYAGIGSDGMLRPVQDWNADATAYGYDGYVYQCCPFPADVCGDAVFNDGPLVDQDALDFDFEYPFWGAFEDFVWDFSFVVAA